jgi:hypothetical protein
MYWLVSQRRTLAQARATHLVEDVRAGQQHLFPGDRKHWVTKGIHYKSSPECLQVSHIHTTLYLVQLKCVIHTGGQS